MNANKYEDQLFSRIKNLKKVAFGNLKNRTLHKIIYTRNVIREYGEYNFNGVRPVVLTY